MARRVSLQSQFLALMCRTLPFDSRLWHVAPWIHERFFRNKSLPYYKYNNILLQPCQAVYFFVPKAACSTLKLACSEILGSECDSSLRPEDAVHTIEFPYATPEELRSKYSQYLKFSFVRNPWSRLVSCYRDKICGDELPPSYARYGVFVRGMEFEAFVRVVASIPDAAAEGHFRSQASYLMAPRSKRLVVDFVGKTESFDADFAELSQRLGISVQELPRLRARSGGKYRDYYSSDLRNMVARRYQDDVELFGYTF